MIETELLSLIRDRRARIVVVGLGYVGLPLALAFASEGFQVTGFDNDASYVERLARGESAIIDVPAADLTAALGAGRFQPTADPSCLASGDAYLICVPTPLSKTRQPDLSYIMASIDTLTRHWNPHSLVVLESTTYPGTTDEILAPALSASGAVLDDDFLLAFSPERVDPGNRSFRLRSIPKVVGGVTPSSATVARELYASIFATVHPVSSARAAELTKLLENTFRNVNIALANEFAQICDTLDVDIWEVVAAAETKPFGYMPFYPGPGIGGHCIPLDPQYLVYKARLTGYEPRLVTLADRINQEMPSYVVQKALLALNARGKPVRGSRVLVAGVAYKANVPDTRESPAFAIIEGLKRLGASVGYVDPFVRAITLEDGFRLESETLGPALLEAVDLVVIVTAHDVPEMALLLDREEIVLDTRNALAKLRSARPAVPVGT